MRKEDLEQYLGEVCLVFKSNGERLKGKISKLTDETLHLQTFTNIRIVDLNLISEVKLSINQNEPNNFH